MEFLASIVPSWDSIYIKIRPIYHKKSLSFLHFIYTHAKEYQAAAPTWKWQKLFFFFSFNIYVFLYFFFIQNNIAKKEKLLACRWQSAPIFFSLLLSFSLTHSGVYVHLCWFIISVDIIDNTIMEQISKFIDNEKKKNAAGWAWKITYLLAAAVAATS